MPNQDNLKKDSSNTSDFVRRGAVLLAIMIGVLAGMGSYTFKYAEGLSYFSKSPEACMNCHIMEPQFDSWQKSSHHTVATCVDCHLPHTFFKKYLAKAENGYNHSKAFTLQNFHEPIQINRKNSRILQQNCLECHGDFVHELLRRSTNEIGAVSCIHCHRSVGHGDTVGMGGPELFK